VPDGGLPWGRRFVARVAATARSALGDPLLVPAAWSFSTRRAICLDGGIVGDPDPQRVPADAIFFATYESPMNRPSVEAGTTLVESSTGAVVPGRFGWFGSSTVIFVPDAPLRPDATYTFRAADEGTWTDEHGQLGTLLAGSGRGSVQFHTAPG
jgi:hypothetical protein